MTVDLENVRIFVRPGSTDLRMAVNGLGTLIQEEMTEPLFSGSVFLFCNKNRKLLKALWWDKTGFWMCQKRLSQERWPWPETGEAAAQITADQMWLLLAGIDFWKAHKELHYSEIA